MQAPRTPSKILLQHGADGPQSDSQDKSTVVQTSQSANYPAFQYNASLHPLDTSQTHSMVTTHRQSPSSAELRVQTDFRGQEVSQYPAPTTGAKIFQTQSRASFSTGNLPVRTPSVKSALAASQYTGGSLSPASAVSSPGLGPLLDITPLPSPLTAGTSPGPWATMPDAPELSPSNSNYGSPPSIATTEPIALAHTSPKKRKAYREIISAAPRVPIDEDQSIVANASSHARNRSLSEYVPGSVQVPRRYVAVSGSQTPTSIEPPASVPMHREEHLAIQRGISLLPTPRPPTPPPSNRSATGSSDLESPPNSPGAFKRSLGIQYEARTIRGGKMRRWRPIRPLGKGTFSTVMLATSEGSETGYSEERKFDNETNTEVDEQINLKNLVAVKICEHGPAGGADEKKIETSLKRELEILKAIHHPSLVHLKAVGIIEKRAYLVLNYSPGGDLFELASLKLDLLTPPLIRRIFAELVAAVQYLHSRYIVHRDIKLENVLVNIPTSLLPTIPSPLTHPTPLITLTDLGLSRYIPQPPSSPLLDTRCGSEDYAAPELLMGQEYDGRATDAWALGVLLYAIMEGRLPFDPVPGARRQSPTSHRIARCEWSWVKWADSEGEWDGSGKGADLEGGRECVEGLLKRAKVRWGLDRVAGGEWVSAGVDVEGGLRVAREEEDEEDG